MKSQALVRNMTAVFGIILVATFTLSMQVAHAQDDYSFDGGGDDSSYGDDYSYDGGSTSYGDDYSTDGTTDYGNDYSYDGTTDYGDDYSTDGLTSYDNDYSYDGSSFTPGTEDDYSTDGSFTPGTEDDSFTPGTEDDCTDSGCFTPGTLDDCSSCVEQNGVTYSEQQYANETPSYEEQQYGYSTPSYETSAPLAISAPESYGYSGGSYGYSAPIIPSAPVIQNVPIAYQQQQQQQQQQVAPAPVTNNTCTNYSCNTVTTISNSGNTTTVVPVTETPVTYPVQYTFPQNYQNVSCTISASPNSIQGGQYTFLSWQSYGAISATLTNYGNVAPNGSLSVQPYSSMNYVLTVYGQNGQTATCNTYITVGNVIPSVTLSQIPYTGFDLGTMGDMLYWAFLALFALAAGYLTVYYKGGMAAFAGGMIPARKTKTPVVTKTVAKTETKAAPATAPVVEKTIEAPVQKPVATFAALPTFSTARPTHDSMIIANHDGAPRIVISRN